MNSKKGLNSIKEVERYYGGIRLKRNLASFFGILLLFIGMLSGGALLSNILSSIFNKVSFNQVGFLGLMVMVLSFLAIYFIKPIRRALR